MPDHSIPDEILASVVTIKSPDGGKARISPYAAHVLSWATADGVERLFLSPRSIYQDGTAIRGGVPVIFPQFAGLGSLPKHGFARVMPWQVSLRETGRVVFGLNASELSLVVWPYHFQVDLDIRITNNLLQIGMAVNNQDGSAFSFTAALHTYLNVAEVRRASVQGLKGLTYRDSAAGGGEHAERNQTVTFAGEVDRIYLNAVKPLLLTGGEKPVTISNQGFRDVVIWNPGAEKCAALKDMEPGGYLRFVCVEAAVIGQPVQLKPGESWQGSQLLTV